jgi:matrilin-3
MIDSSRSVRPFEFETMRQFLVGLLRSLDVGLNATRVGVIQYSSQVQSVFPLGAFSRREDMERAIRAVVPLAQGTMTGLAIQYAMNVAFSEAEGARPSEERVPRVLVIVTDGRPQDRVAEVAAQARARGIEIYAVGVQRADVGSLRTMASPPLDQHVFLVESFDLIQEFGLQFQGRLCGELEWHPAQAMQMLILVRIIKGDPSILLCPLGTSCRGPSCRVVSLAASHAVSETDPATSCHPPLLPPPTPNVF